MNILQKLLLGAVILGSSLLSLERAESAVVYTNSLRDGSKVVSDFTDYSTINSDYIDTLTGGWFLADSNNGLSLLSVAPNYEDGVAAYNRTLTASNDWTITVQAHLSQFTNTQTNPFYTVGMSLVKTTSSGLEYPNRLDINLTRSGLTGSAMSNFIVSGIYVNNGEANSLVNRNIPDAYFQFKYLAATKVVTTSYATNGSNYFPVQSYNLSKLWALKPTDGLTLGLAANNQPEGRVVPNYSVTPGQIYLKNLVISSPTAPATLPSSGGSVSGGTLSMGGSVSGVQIVNGGLNTYFAGWSTNPGSSPLVLSNAYTNIGGVLTLDTNVVNSSSTNFITGGGVVNGGSNTVNFTNPAMSGGTNSNTPGGLPGGGSIGLPVGGGVIH